MEKLYYAERVIPTGYVIVSEVAISWLYANYPDIYREFERLSEAIPNPNKKPLEKGVYISSLFVVKKET